MDESLRVLLITASEDMGSLVLPSLQNSGFNPTWERVQTAESFRVLLNTQPWDVILADDDDSECGPLVSLAIAHQNQPDIPLIVLASQAGDRLAVEMLKAGAHDYLKKDELNRLPEVIRHALQEAQIRADRKRIEASLKLNAARATATFTQAALGFAESNLQTGQFTFVNPCFCTMTGYGEAELLGMAVTELTHPEDTDAATQALQQLCSGQIQHVTLKQRYICADQTLLPTETTMYLVHLEEEQEMACLALIQDIRERKRLEAEHHLATLALQETQQQYGSLVSAVPAGVFRKNADQQMIYVNDRYCEILGLSREAALGNGWAQGLYPDDCDPVNAAWSAFIETDHPFQAEYRFQSPDGAVKWIYSQCEVERNATGQVIGYVGSVTDISDRKQAETVLKNLITGIAATTGQKVIPTLVGHIAVTLNVSCVMVAETIGDTMHTLAVWSDGALQPNYTCNLIHTPYAQVLQQGELYCESAVRERFPQAIDLARLEAESYLGKALYNTEGTAIGHLCIVHKAPIPDIKQADYLLCVFADRTAAELERRRAITALEALNIELEAKIQERTKVFAITQAAVDWAADSVFLVRPDGSLHYANNTACEQLGYSQTELLELTIYDIDPLSSPNEWTDLWQTLKQRSTLTLESQHQPKEGPPYPVEVHAKYLEFEGEAYSFSFVRDISERKQAEATIRQEDAFRQQILENITEGLCVCHPLRTFPFIQCTVWNQKMQEITGYTQAEINRLGWVKCLHPEVEDAQGYVTRYLEQIRQSNGLLAQETVIQRKDGCPRTVALSLSILPNVDEPLTVLVLMQDITERKQAEQQLHYTNQKLARATRLKDEFLANMSHELRTPLNAILGMTEGLKEQVFGEIHEQQLKPLQTIERSGTHLLELIDDILDVAKIESGQMQLELAPTNVAILCRASLAFIKQQAQKKSLQVEVQLPSYLPEIRVDERRIRQVLINLLSNGVKFTPEAGRITLTVTLQQRSGIAETGPPSLAPISTLRDVLRIEVRDTGIGIAAEHLSRLFEPFVQIDSTLNRQYAGSGLGLALVKRIVELHGGTVSVTSEVGVGSCFTVDIPYGLPRPTALATAPQSKPSLVPSPDQSTASPFILLAEDHEANIETISSYLGAKGYRLQVAKTGQEAIALAQTETPDLILMDIQMPEMDGLEATQLIRRDPNPNLRAVPIIALTALAMKGDRDRCVAAGANDYIAKPVKLKQLVTMIQSLLECSH